MLPNIISYDGLDWQKFVAVIHDLNLFGCNLETSCPSLYQWLLSIRFQLDQSIMKRKLPRTTVYTPYYKSKHTHVFRNEHLQSGFPHKNHVVPLLATYLPQVWFSGTPPTCKTSNIFLWMVRWSLVPWFAYLQEHLSSKWAKISSWIIEPYGKKLGAAE